MPTTVVNKKKLLGIAGKNINDEELAEKLVYMGTTVDKKIEGNEFNVESYVNRPDFLSEGGLGRALQGILRVKKGIEKFKVNKSKYTVVVDKSVEKIRPYAAFAVVKNITVDDAFIRSFMQLQEKLDVTHCRKRRLAGMGAYDLDELKFPILYTTIPWTTKFVPLLYDKEMMITQIFDEHPKGKEYGYILGNPKEAPAYVDSNNKIMCAIPVTQAQFGKITEKTKNILLEVTGVNWNIVNEVLNILVTNLADEFNAEIYEVTVDYPYNTPGGNRITFPKLEPRRAIKFSVKYCNKLLGTEFTAKQVADYLEIMRFGAKVADKDNVNVEIPCYRTDIMHQIDLVEDVAIAHGYNNFEPQMPNITTIGEEAKETIFERKIAEICSGLQLLECQTFHLSSEDVLVKKMNFEKMNDIVSTTNSIDISHDKVRNRILPMLIEVLSRNTHYEYPQQLFEIGEAIKKQGDNIKQDLHLAIVSAHNKADYVEIRGIVEEIFRSTGHKIGVVAKDNTTYIQGRCAAIIFDNKEIGLMGEIHPQVLNNFGIEVPVAAMEINLQTLLEKSQ